MLWISPLSECRDNAVTPDRISKTKFMVRSLGVVAFWYGRSKHQGGSIREIMVWSWEYHWNIYIYIYIFIYDLSIWLGLPFPVIKCGKLEIPELAMEVCGWEIHWTTLWIFQHVAFDSWRVSMDLSWIDDQCISTTMFGHGKSVTHRTYMI